MRCATSPSRVPAPGLDGCCCGRIRKHSWRERTNHRRRPDRGRHADRVHRCRSGGRRRRRPCSQKTGLELGGSDAFIVLADADLDAAAAWAVRSRFQNTRQSCIATKRIIVEARVFDPFTERFLDGVSKLRVGQPLDHDVTVGPLARRDLRDILARQVAASSQLGARLLAGGNAIEGSGFFYEPTVLDRVTPDMPVWSEEVFGPAVPILSAPTAEAGYRLEPHSVRARQQHLDRRHRTRSIAGPADAGWPHSDQRHHSLGRQASVRRSQGLRLPT